MLALLSSAFFSEAQVNVTGRFLADSIAIGQPLAFYLTARYPQSSSVLFPDSSYSFEPFEYISKRYFPTVTRQGTSYDSVVYLLRTFELAPVQWLSLPVFLPSASDSSRFYCLPDSLHLVNEVNVLPPDTIPLTALPLKTNTEYQLVQFLFNYPVFIILVGSLLLAAIIGWLVFGKRIKRYFRMKRLKKDYAAFANTFGGYVNGIRNQFNPQLTERSVALWKSYLEKLEGKPYTKLTTRELMKMELNEASLGPSLKILDGAIYGHLQQVDEPLTNLGRIAEQRFIKKLNEVKHG
jgi:hypothetical protein